VRFSTRGVQKHQKKLFGENTCQKLLAEKVVIFFFSPFVFSHRFFFIAFLAVSLHEEPKNTIKIFSQIRPENLKKSQKKVPWYLPRFFSPSSAPLAVYNPGRGAAVLCVLCGPPGFKAVSGVYGRLVIDRFAPGRAVVPDMLVVVVFGCLISAQLGAQEGMQHLLGDVGGSPVATGGLLRLPSPALLACTEPTSFKPPSQMLKVLDSVVGVPGIHVSRLQAPSAVIRPDPYIH
jgi:hypothetical protein